MSINRAKVLELSLEEAYFKDFIQCKRRCIYVGIVGYMVIKAAPILINGLKS